MELIKDTNETSVPEMDRAPEQLSDNLSENVDTQDVAHTPEENVTTPEPAPTEAAADATEAPAPAPEPTPDQPEPTPEVHEPVAEQPAPQEAPAETVRDIVVNEATVQQDPQMKELPTTPDDYCGELQEAIETGAVGMLNKHEIIDKLKELVGHAEDVTREQFDKLRQSYYRIVKAESEELKRVFLEGGGNEDDFETPIDDTLSVFKEVVNRFKERKAEAERVKARVREENYVKKLNLIDRIKGLIESPDDFNRRYNEFRDIQQKWKEYDPVPQEHVKDLWRDYQVQSERFYDLVKINHQLRDYDFKKNLERKLGLTEAAQKLLGVNDVVSAYRNMQQLFQQWREIGPVPREKRDEVWNNFKEIMTQINKKHQSYFETLRAKEAENLKEKTALCEIVEAVVYDDLKTFKDWEKKTEEVIGLQKKWRTIGFASRKQNQKIYDRFHAACDEFFKKRNEFFRSIRKDLDENLKQKKALLEKAEALKESTDWKETTQAMIELQSEWKKIGPSQRRHSEPIWKRFNAACDYFFERKNQAFAGQRDDEKANLEAKNEIVRKIEALDELPDDEALTTLKALIADWKAIGYVPFKEKEKAYDSFRKAVDAQYTRLNVAQADRKLRDFRSGLSDMAEKGKTRIHTERERLMRTYERMKSEIQTYENNLGFLNISSKGGSGLLKEMERKLERLREEMALVVKKIDAIDENLE